MTASPPGPFDLEGFQALPRVTGLAASPDGRRAVVEVSSLDRTATRFVGALWEVDPAGVAPVRRLTRSGKGESAPVFTPDGDVLFVSGRPDADAEDDEAPAALWLLPAAGGEARQVVTRPGGVTGVAVARAAGTVVVASPTLPSSTDDDVEAERVKDRKQAKVRAVLHDSFPVRFWDHDLGPAAPRLFVATRNEAEAWTLRDLTGHVGHALDEARFDLTPDGTTVVTEWSVAEAAGAQRGTVVALDVATGAVRPLAGDADHEYAAPRVSPDGRTVALLRERRSTPTLASAVDVVVVDVGGGAVRPVTGDWDGWPHAVRWTPDGSALVVTADHHGTGPLFRVPVPAGTGARSGADVDAPLPEPVALTRDHGAYHDVEVLPGGDLMALRDAVDAPPAPVRVAAADGTVTRLPSPPARGRDVGAPGDVGTLDVGGRLEQVTATAADGTPLRAWLALPAGAGPDAPAPLVLWIHGGPLSSWNGWSWRWNPWLMTARGYAVLLPDPALSTGYGQRMVDRGWGAWGAAPYTDLMTITDAALAHPALDPTRTAAMGGSFGGYMANWIAGHTDRFAAIVTHASLWNLETFGATTDAAWYWNRELTPQAAHDNSPHRFADAITTPMLVVHGDKDYRVPIGEGLALWWSLASRAPDPATAPSPHRFLYFPDENHWVLTPNHARVWYETVLAFLDQHVLGRAWERPPRLG